MKNLNELHPDQRDRVVALSERINRDHRAMRVIRTSQSLLSEQLCGLTALDPGQAWLVSEIDRIVETADAARAEIDQICEVPQ